MKPFPLPQIPVGASESGSHYTGLFANCSWKFYMRFVRGWKSLRTSSPLLNGACFHYAKACFYATGSKNEALKAVARFLATLRSEYETEDELEMARLRLPSMISLWVEKYGFQDLKRYMFLEIEKEHSITLLGGFRFTFRLDALVRDSARNLLILETKTSGWRPELTELDIFNGDQATAYVASVSELYKTPPARIYLLPNILSWPKNSKKPSQINCYRGELVQRTASDVEEWKLGKANELAEISQKVSALKEHSPYALFRRNTSWCTSFFRPCEFLTVCRQRIEAGHTPYGFRHDPELPDLFPKKARKK